MKAYLAEMAGTFILVFGGCGSAVLAGDAIGYSGVAFAFGLSLLAMIYAVGPISGCHLNPAVTFGLVLSGRFLGRSAPGYVVAQIAGAGLAAAVLFVIAQGAAGFDAVADGFASNGYGSCSPGGYGMLSAFLAEVVLTALLVLTVLGATDVKAPVGFAGVAIGLVLVVIHLVGIPITNTSVNPARSIGVALFAGWPAVLQLWLFIVAPLAGAALAAAVYGVIHLPGPPLTVREAERATPAQQAERLT
ncbi:aquaporin Z [Marinimicrococcus flavescens]|uniref:Aquaporin Z n=1 Tax=Marinimicrococcus flavescens TaxID=3031815 RepID=A0AAP3XRV2_9PROT|nr:aquaporin Z [Marinimicrococcus flavescens]